MADKNETSAANKAEDNKTGTTSVTAKTGENKTVETKTDTVKSQTQTDGKIAESGGESAEGDKNAGSKLEAARQSGADSSVSPKSDTLQNPGAELRADLTQDVHAANRAAMQIEVRAGEGSNDIEKLQELHQRVADAQTKVDEAIRERDAARDAFDRQAEELATASARPFSDVTSDYFKAADEQLAEQAKIRKQFSALGLSTSI